MCFVNDINEFLQTQFSKGRTSHSSGMTEVEQTQIPQVSFSSQHVAFPRDYFKRFHSKY